MISSLDWRMKISTQVVLLLVSLLLFACDPFRVRIVTLSTSSESSVRSEQDRSNRIHAEAFKIVEAVAQRNGLRSKACAGQESKSICKAFDGAVYLEAYVTTDGEFRVRFLDTSAISSLNRIEEEVTSALRQKFGDGSVKVRN